MRFHGAVLFFALLLFLVPAKVRAQEPLSYTHVVSQEGVSTDDLYRRAKVWAAEAFRSANDVTQLDDPEGHILILKASMPYSQSFLSGSGATEGNIRYSVKIQCKEGRYKYEFYDFIHDATGTRTQYGTSEIDLGLVTEGSAPLGGKPMKDGAQSWREKVWDDIKKVIQRTVYPLEESLEAAMAKSSSSDEEW